VLSPMPDLQVYEGRVAISGAHGIDLDGVGLTYSLTQAPPGATLDARNGNFFWATRSGDAGDHLVNVMVTDRICNAQVGFVITVIPVPPPAPSMDSDYDGVADVVDDCPAVADHWQTDFDGDGVGDACDPSPCGSLASGDPAPCPGDDPTLPPNNGMVLSDWDADGVLDLADVCPRQPNADQADLDADLLGDMCDSDLDGDGVPQMAPRMPGAAIDNCPLLYNPTQADLDGDGHGDACGAQAAGPQGPRPQTVPPPPLGNPALMQVAWVTAGLLGAALPAAVLVIWAAGRRKE